jgi:hypothetical protein
MQFHCKLLVLHCKLFTSVLYYGVNMRKFLVMVGVALVLGCLGYQAQAYNYAPYMRSAVLQQRERLVQERDGVRSDERTTPQARLQEIAAQRLRTLETPRPSPLRRGGLTEGRLRACQAHEQALKQRSEQLVRMATNMLGVFNRSVERVTTFYTTQLVPQGHTLANYDALLATIRTRQAAVETALVKAQETAAQFSCDAENPKTSLQQFRRDMQAVKSSLQEFRRSVRDLITAVRTLAGNLERQTTPVPTPSSTPVLLP